MRFFCDYRTIRNQVSFGGIDRHRKKTFDFCQKLNVWVDQPRLIEKTQKPFEWQAYKKSQIVQNFFTLADKPAFSHIESRPIFNDLLETLAH